MATIGTLSDPVALRRGSSIAWLPSGGFVVGNTHEPGTLSFYDERGQYVRSFGRAGGGPGEFEANPLGVTFGLDRHGRLHVIERSRRTILNPDLSSIYESHAITRGYDDALVMPDGDLLLVSTLSSRYAAEQFLHVDVKGNVIRTFTRGADIGSPVALEAAQDSSFWVLSMYSYRMEKLGPAGEPFLVLKRSPDWFTTSDNPSALFGGSRLLNAMHGGEGSLMYVLTRVPTSTAREEVKALREARLYSLDMNHFQDSVIDVLNPATGEVVATRRVEESLTFIGPGLAAFFVEADSGLISARVVRVELVSPDSGR